MSRVSLPFPTHIDGGRAAVTAGDFFGSNRLRSADVAPLAGLSAKMVSRATCVDAVDFLGHVPYQLLFELRVSGVLAFFWDFPAWTADLFGRARLRFDSLQRGRYIILFINDIGAFVCLQGRGLCCRRVFRQYWRRV